MALKSIGQNAQYEFTYPRMVVPADLMMLGLQLNWYNAQRSALRYHVILASVIGQPVGGLTAMRSMDGF